MTPQEKDLKKLKILYYDEIDHFEGDIDQLEVIFNSLCDQIKAATHERLNALPKEDFAGRKQVIAEEKETLEKMVSDLKLKIKKDSKEVRETLEKIQMKIDEVTL